MTSNTERTERFDVGGTSIEIIPGSEYPQGAWRAVTDAIDAAEAAVRAARRVKAAADAAYDEAIAEHAAARIPRDRMIATDTRASAQVGRLAGIGRARAAQIRLNAAGAEDASAG